MINRLTLKGMLFLTKKERLKKQAEKQREMIKQEEKKEESLKEKNKKSRAVEKYSKSKESLKKKSDEPKYYLLLKLLELVPYGYSVIFWGGVLVIAILGDMINDYEFSEVSDITAVCIIVSAVILALAFVFQLFKKYLIGFVASLVGAAVYFSAIRDFIRPITNYLQEKAVDPELIEMDKLWMKRCYPVWVFAALSFVLLCDKTVRYIIRKKKEKEKKDNAPVKSIISD